MLVYDGTSLHAQTLTNTNNAQVSYDSSSFSHSYSNGTLTITSTSPQFISGVWCIDYSYGGTSGNIKTADTQVGSGATSITFTVDATAGSKYVVKVNGEVVSASEGKYSYTVKATDTAVAITVELDYALSEAIDGVKGEGYGAPMTIKVEGEVTLV